MNLNVVVTDMKMPWHSYNLVQGSTVTIESEYHFKSDKPAECMVCSFDKGSEKTYNYFSCKTCGINWVCEPCREGCHSGHETLPHLKEHKPAFACCYCVKKGFCKIKNKK